LRIQRALSKPGAVGMKGFLLWTEAAWPTAIADKIVAAANKYTPGAGPVVTLASPAQGGFGLLGDFAWGSIPADDASTDPTTPVMSGTTAATASQPASSSWMSDISKAVTAATTAFLGYTQVKDAQSIFQTNLMRAQQGLAPIPTNPAQYGLPSPTANIGLTSSATNTLLMVAGIGAGALVLASIARGKGRRG
jgi:hypothetical protein